MTAPAAPRRASILAVDDTPANLELLVECLSPRYDVRVATSGERALKLCGQRPPDLVLLDVMMPGMDGFEVLRRLKADPKTADVPVIFATAKDDKGDEHAGLELGAADYVSKPIHIPVLLARVATHLSLQDHRRHLQELVRQRTDELGRALRQVEQDERSLQASRARLEFMHSHDALTSLPNQQFLVKRLGEEMRRSLLESSQLAIVTFNIDRLRGINQSLGMAAGDEALIHVAGCLQDAVESPDLPARLGADDFALLVTRQPGESALEPRARALAESVLESVAGSAAESVAADLTLSGGIALFPDDGVSPTELLRNSLGATAAAKRAGRNRVLRYATGLAGIDGAERFRLQTELRQVIQEQRLRPHYQPKVDARNGALVGAEALVRWPVEGGEFRSPGEFIPLAEEYGLIEALDDQVMRAVLRQLAEWRPRLPTGFRIAVNVTSNRFHDDGYAGTVAAMLRETGADPRHLELEITEGALIGDMAACLRNLKALRALDVHFALDDFGTGYSSLSYLKQLPLQKLKVDQSFIRDIDRDENDAAIVQAVLALASALHLETIAEGVETPSQLAFVQRLGCNVIQGFLFSPAVDAARFSALLDAGRLEQAPLRSR